MEDNDFISQDIPEIKTEPQCGLEVIKQEVDAESATEVMKTEDSDVFEKNNVKVFEFCSVEYKSEVSDIENAEESKIHSVNLCKGKHSSGKDRNSENPSEFNNYEKFSVLSGNSDQDITEHNRTFSKESQLKNNGHTDSSVKTYSCGKCGEKFVDKSHLICHEIVHSYPKSYSCSVCRKTFDKNCYLNRHMLTHTGTTVKPFSCTQCGSRFTARHLLMRHIRTHSGARPFSCSLCSKQFTQNSSLERHMLSHTNEKCYKCNQCSKSFAVKSYLEAHMKTHTGVRPYTCEVCGRSYSNKTVLIQHMNIHFGNKLFSCDICGKSYNYQSSLTQHMKRIH